MSKWPIENLHNKITIKHGFPFKSEFFSDQVTNYIVLTPGNFLEKGGFKRQVGKEKFYKGEVPEDYLHDQGDLIVAMTEQAAGLLGSCARVPVSGVYLHNQRLGLIKANSNKISLDYVYHLFKTKSVREQIRASSSGSKVKHTSPERIYDVKVSLPSLYEQQSIAALLDTIDRKIELNNKISAELETMAKLIYDYWFVQFDFPDANGKPYKSSGGKMVYNQELKREIPEGWNSYALGSILNTELGGTPSTKVSEYWLGQIPWLDSGEVANFPIIESEKLISESAITNSATKLMPKGTCTLSITRHLRPSILAVSACVNQSVVGVLENNEVKNSYIYPYLVNEIPRLMSLRTGAQQPHINKGIVDKSPILIPKNEILNVYYEKVDPLYNQINNNAFQNKELISLRDWLLPMLMNGQVVVNKK